MKILEARTTDIPLIQSVARRSWEATYNPILSKEQSEYMLEMMYGHTEMASHFENPKYRYITISDDETFLGFAGYEFNYETDTTKLHRIYLLPEAQGKGAGKALIEHIKKEVSRFGNNRIILAVNKQNKARQFYEKLGFAVYGEGVFDIGRGFVMDDYLLELVLENQT
ncbi:MAG: GNAT family N-acetyltransferase [Capnocytophaga sp.]|nr:GNAT family N-acetyltransferase [Capnocytophaga sp.]